MTVENKRIDQGLKHFLEQQIASINRTQNGGILTECKLAVFKDILENLWRSDIEQYMNKTMEELEDEVEQNMFIPGIYMLLGYIGIKSKFFSEI